VLLAHNDEDGQKQCGVNTCDREANIGAVALYKGREFLL